MATATSRLGLTKPAGNENKQVVVYNDNLDDIDAAIGAQWVADGAPLPAKPYHGAVVQELTSGKMFTLKDNGVGGFTKVPHSCYGLWTNTLATPSATGYGPGTLVADPANDFPAGGVGISTDTLTITIPGTYVVTYFVNHTLGVTGRSYIAIKVAGTHDARSSYANGEDHQSTTAIVNVPSTGPVAVTFEIYLTWATGNVNHKVKIVKVD